MKAIIWRDIRHFFTGKVLFLLFGCLLFGIAERQSTSHSYEQFVLHMLSEHYYLTYFMIPVFLLFTYKSLEDDMDYVLIRSHFYRKYFLAKALGLFLNMIGFVGAQIAVIMLLGMGMPSNNSFVVSGVHSTGGVEEVFLAYADHLNSPITAIIAASAYMIVGLTVISILFLMLHHFLEKKTVSVVMIALYVLMTFGLKVPGLNEIPFLFINNYIILFYNFASSGALVTSLISMLLILLVTAIMIRFYWQKRPKWQFGLRRKGITFYYARYLFTKRNVIILLAVLFLISIWKLINATAFQEATARDFFLSLFYGHGVNEFYIIGFLEMLILNGAPIYLFAIFLETIHREQNLGLTIRMKYKKNWARAIVRIAISFIAMYVAIMTGIGIVLAMTNDFSMNGMAGLLLEMAVLKFLDLSFQYFLFIVLFIWKRHVTMAFLVVVSTNVVSILPMTWVIYFPTGLSSMARSSHMLGEEGVSFIMGALILTVFVCGQWAYIKLKGYQKFLGG